MRLRSSELAKKLLPFLARKIRSLPGDFFNAFNY